MNIETRLKKIESLIDPEIKNNLVLEFLMLFKGRREAFEAEGKEDLYDRFHKALEKEPDRNIDLIGEIYTPDEEKRIMRIFEKRGLKV